MADNEWGLDHGAWCVLKHMFPDAQIPVFQLSLDLGKNPAQHLALAKELQSLRRRGVLVVGSGNIVHNIARIRPGAEAFDWALEFDDYVKQALIDNDNAALTNLQPVSAAAALAVPTADHYLPLLYTQGFREKTDELSFFAESIDMGSMSMRCMLLQSTI